MLKITSEQAASELRAIFRGWADAVGADKNHAFLNRHLDEGWRYIDFNGVVRGRDEYYELVDIIVSYTQEFQRLDVRTVGDDIAITSGVYRSTVELKNGTRGDSMYALTAVWQLQDGVWKALVLHTTRLAEPSAGWPR